MACEPASNRGKYDFYRGVIEKSLAKPEALTRFPVNDQTGQMAILHGWEHRYLYRYLAVESNTLYGTQLADRPAAELLMARHRQRDALFPELPDWPEMLIFFVNVVRMTGPRAKQDWNGDPPVLESRHGYGPSLRELWGRAKAAGAGDEAAWEAIREWALYRPPSWERDDLRRAKRQPLYTGELAQCLDTEVVWGTTRDPEFVWSADARTSKGVEHWRVRLNDFPDEYMYRLVAEHAAGEPVTGNVIGDFHDWPPSWKRAEGPGWVDPKSSKKLTVFAAPQDIAADRLLERYLQGEHERVWEDLIRLGAAVRHKPYREPAEAVCREMVRRSRENLCTLFAKLHEMDFEF